MFSNSFENYTPKSILLIEDSEEIVTLVKMLLAQSQILDIRVVSVPSIGAARPYLLSTSGVDFDLILTDLNILDSSGINTLQQIRQLRQDLPIVVMTGCADETSGIQALYEGAQDFLLKDESFPIMLYRVLTYACYRFIQERELKLAKQQTDAANATKDKFVALVAHDVRGPLGAIAGLAGVLQGAKQESTLLEYREVINEIKHAADDLSHLLEEILDLSKLKTGKVVPQCKFVDAYLLANNAIKRLKRFADNKQLTICNTIPAGTRLFADEALITQVLQNLLSNAIKFSHLGKKIEIFLPEQTNASIAVRDEGVGIRPEKIVSLFKIEERTSSRGTSGESGTGFGLPLVAEIIAAHHGEIAINSVVGQGSTVRFSLPLVKPTVLIVDDDRIFRQIQQLHLQSLDINIQLAVSGAQALTMLQSFKPDLCLIDISMPEMSGFELLKAIRNDPQTESIPIIMVTADDNLETRQQAIREGADDYVLKPIVPHDLIPRVQRFII